MSSAPRGVVDRTCDSETGCRLESTSVKSGAFWPTCGAPVEAGSCLASTRMKKAKKIATNAPRAATIEAMTFPCARWTKERDGHHKKEHADPGNVSRARKA